MKILVEAKFGDAHVTVANGDYREKTAHQMKMAADMRATGVPDAASVAEFIRPLAGLDSTDLDDLAARLPATPLPTGYRHFRLFNGVTGEQWNHTFVYGDRSTLTLHDVLFGALNHPTLELSLWRSTEWLPDMIRGVLDLELFFATRPRTKRMRLKL
ncbi:hypothetical protein ASE86_07515 [Sphingomonas sp. Leaf33]|uniref:hypothetical protein n=1 Tax=Sphingomonas sp. Leaf33 TaxID=1736215 RepID=UPI0007009171|nr:hypothetical protein [Sphingomonas sp. Leaf33]KQN26009.1 hypothetical protein ASE86_07515 [Sphingomonas sp. Leaf33]